MNNDNPIATALGEVVEKGQLAGAATMVWRDGQVLEAVSVGWRDMGARLPVTGDTLFRIASMSKPITSMAALMMLEERRFSLEDPIARVAPEFARMRVLRSPTGSLDDTEPAVRQITFEDLLTHRSGLTYGSFHAGPIAQAYADALGGDVIDNVVAPDNWIAGLAAMPLINHPGADFHYGCSTDLLGLLIARMENAPLGEVLARRIFSPLGMTDTGFTVPAEKRDRRAAMYGFDARERLTPLVVAPDGATVAERPDDMTYVSGGAGLWSTVNDYLKFARLFVEGGAVDGVRLLRPETLALMIGNRLTEDQRSSARIIGMPVFGTGNGFGLGVAVTLDPKTAFVMRGRGGVGTVGWPGAYGGWWQADPTDRSVMIILMHNMVELEQIAQGVGLGGYGAILQFHTIASALRR